MEKVNKILCVIIVILTILLGIVSIELIKEKKRVDDNLEEIFFLTKELDKWQKKATHATTDNEAVINQVD